MDLLPGFVQGIVRVAISYPFDSLKVYMQKGIYPNTLSCLINVYRIDPKILYRGASLSFVLIPIDRSIQYFFAEKLNQKYNSYVAGFILGSFSTLYQVPLQYISTNAILTRKENYGNILEFTRKLNPRHMYRGYTVEFPRIIIATTAYLGTYMALRKHVKTEYQVYMSPFLGSLAGMASWITIFPLDTIRTERQTTNKTIPNIIWDKYRGYGIRSFYLGITPVLFRTIPSASFGMLAYEYTKKLLK